MTGAEAGQHGPGTRRCRPRTNGLPDTPRLPGDHEPARVEGDNGNHRKRPLRTRDPHRYGRPSPGQPMEHVDGLLCSHPTSIEKGDTWAPGAQLGESRTVFGEVSQAPAPPALGGGEVDDKASAQRRGEADGRHE